MFRCTAKSYILSPVYRNGEGDDCPICLSGPTNDINNPFIKICNLGHEAHLKCICEWIKRTPTCPLCRGDTVAKCNPLIIPEGQSVIYRRSSLHIRERGIAVDSLIIPSTVYRIDTDALREQKLTDVTIPGNVKYIGSRAFSDNKLESVSFNSGLMEIGDFAFKSNKLKFVEIPDSVIEIGGGAFLHNSLTSVAISKSVKNLRNSVFHNNQLEHVTIPPAVTWIGNNAFSENQLTSLTIPNGVTHIGMDAFAENRLSSLIIPESVTKISAGAFFRNILSSLIIPESVTEISAGAFADNRLSNLIIPESVTKIDDHAFFGNILTSLIVPNGVIHIGEAAFAKNRLSSLIIPESVTKISAGAFVNNLLLSVTMSTKVTVENGAFDAHVIVKRRTKRVHPDSLHDSSEGITYQSIISYVEEFIEEYLEYVHRLRLATKVGWHSHGKLQPNKVANVRLLHGMRFPHFVTFSGQHALRVDVPTSVVADDFHQATKHLVAQPLGQGVPHILRQLVVRLGRENVEDNRRVRSVAGERHNGENRPIDGRRVEKAHTGRAELGHEIGRIRVLHKVAILIFVGGVQVLAAERKYCQHLDDLWTWLRDNVHRDSVVDDFGHKWHRSGRLREVESRLVWVILRRRVEYDQWYSVPLALLVVVHLLPELDPLLVQECEYLREVCRCAVCKPRVELAEHQVERAHVCGIIEATQNRITAPRVTQQWNTKLGII